jgi:hypothetical protein
LHRKFETAFGQDRAGVLVVRAPSRLLNPSLSEGALERAREADPQNAKAEWDAEFRNDIADYVTRAAVEACVEAGVFERPPKREWFYHAFVDPSGGAVDSMTLALAHKEGETALLDAVREVRPPFNPEAVVDEFAALVRRYRVSTVRGDRYAGEWVATRFRAAGVNLEPSDRSKSELYLDLLPIINSGGAALLDNERMVAQLVSLERKTARGGRESIDHPPGGFDDIANAVAGALVAASIGAESRLGDLGEEKPEKSPLDFDDGPNPLAGW